MKRRDGEDRPSPAADEEPEEPRGMEAVDPQPSAPATHADVEALRNEVEELRTEVLRRRADFENYKKRMERDRQQAGEEAVFALFKALIPSLDNLERALAAEGPDASLREGVELIYRELLGLLASRGVSIQDPVGERFDPTVHQAIAHEPAPGYEEGTVFDVLRKGYLLHGRLLRPALVKVAKATEDEPDGPGRSGDAVH